MQTTPTKLSLDRWARIMGLNPLHFWGVDMASLSRSAGQGPICDSAWFQYEWQNVGAVSRDDVARAIAEAEAEIEELVGYHLLPDWRYDEWQPSYRPLRKEFFNLNSRDLRGFQQGVTAQRGYAISGGIRGFAEVSYGEAIAYSNTIPPVDYDNLATVTFTIAAEIDDCEIAVYYPGHPGDDSWRILPVSVSHTAGLTYTVTFARQQCLIEAFLNSYDLASLRGADGLDDANFLDTVDVGRVYLDPSQQATLLWEPNGECSLNSSSSNIGDGWSAQTGVLLPRGDPRLGQFAYQAANYDAATGTWSAASFPYNRAPDLVRLWYYSGLRDQRKACPLVEMDDEWSRVVAHFAASKLDKPPCVCAKAGWEYWRQDLASTGGAEQLSSFQLSVSDLGNTLGTRRGAIEAWRRIKRPGAAIGRVAIDG